MRTDLFCAIGIASLSICLLASSALAQPAPPPPPAAWPQEPAPPAGAPNILLIMTDDVGFGSTSAYGGPVPTPTFDALAAAGLRYNRFNTTALCAPTRAALLTGRDPHNAGMGTLTDIPRPYPGYDGVVPKSAGTVATILKQTGYSTAAFGKWHLTPKWEVSQTGPFDRWPTGMGFEHYYGFLGGDANQWAPALYEDTKPVEPGHDPGYILDRDLADKSIAWLRQQHAIAPTKPFFLYYATGTAHAPHSAPPEWLARFRGQFDQGWDRMREQIFARQKAMGVIPADAVLTPRPPELPAWDSLSADQRKLFSRLMEAYAAALSFADHEIGRVIQSLRDSGQLDNTMVVFLQGDNGSSAEGGLRGLLEEGSFVEGVDEDLKDQLARIDEIGGPKAYNSYPAGWGWAMDTPFQYYKQIASHLGGVRNGLVISWPGHIRDVGAVRSQFAYVADILPTILEAASVTPPTTLDGVAQRPIDGISLGYTLTAPDAPSRRVTQVFEMVNNLGVYHDGWWANSVPAKQPWDLLKPVAVSDARQWQLYDLAHDYSQAHDLAGERPDKLAEMRALFDAEAARNRIYPLRNGPDAASLPKPTLGAERTEFTYYPGMTRIAEDAAPHVIGRSYTIDADIVSTGHDQGVIVTHGGRFGGYGLYFKDGRPTFRYNATGPRRYTVAAREAAPAGPHRLQATFTSDGGAGSGGMLTLSLDGRQIAADHIPHTLRAWINISEGLDVGRDTVTPISDDYSIAASGFTGRLDEVRFTLK